MTQPPNRSIVYRHRQWGVTIFLGLLGAVAFAVGTVWMTGGHDLRRPMLMVWPVLGLFAVAFSTLTITVDTARISWAFSLGLFPDSIDISRIVNAKIVKVSWWEGWGVRASPNGRLMRVSGLQAVEIKTGGGRRVRLGSDQPAELLAAIERARTSAA
jgi:membrane protein YdbS with pleckstrin-like domain